jgi:hypothetical protein
VEPVVDAKVSLPANAAVSMYVPACCGVSWQLAMPAAEVAAEQVDPFRVKVNVRPATVTGGSTDPSDN